MLVCVKYYIVHSFRRVVIEGTLKGGGIMLCIFAGCAIRVVCAAAGWTVVMVLAQGLRREDRVRREEEQDVLVKVLPGIRKGGM